MSDDNEPVAVARIHRTGGNAGFAWSGIPTESAPCLVDGTPLYLHSQPEALARLTRERDDARQALQAMTDDRDSWEQQASDRTDDALQFARERDESLAEVERLRAVAESALDALSCGHTGNLIEDSHRCGRCDENVDRNGKIRTALIAAIDAARAAKGE